MKETPKTLAVSPSEIYELEKEVGRGQYGKVYKGKVKATHEAVAIKELFLDVDADEDTFKSLATEIQMLMDCDHKNIVGFHGHGIVKSEQVSHLWIVMEYCGGGSVKRLMNKTGKGLEELQIAAICRHSLKALRYLKQNKKVHRDIKADNILLSEQGAAKIADMGVAAQLQHTSDFQKTTIGTPYWMAPEMVNQEHYSYKVDVWALGITAIEMAEMKPPLSEHLPMRALFIIAQEDAENPTLANPEKWSNEFNDFLRHCIIRNPELRSTPEELLEHPFITKVAKKNKEIIVELLEECDHIVESKKQIRLERAKQRKGKNVFYRCTMVPLCENCSIYTEAEPWSSINRSQANASVYTKKVSEIELPDLVVLMKDPTQGLKTTTTKIRKKVYGDTFSGYELVSWISSYLNIPRKNGLGLGKELMTRGIIEHITW
eukprot:CAMPEP_0174252312 /NCGR_PEP_ID=MMETSP0439-20130205/1836_1 /TAXON_ID=0 /ORGANISM="Stereomyxa ramosa, Strain Chinc5" /LENGTH=431 /DNA_ID=CAMNT_0015332829 /DNA_START=62 /DNA_END=1354 /DNA_ORIENTATION=+